MTTTATEPGTGARPDPGDAHRELRSQVRDWFARIMPEVRGTDGGGAPPTEEEDFARRARYSATMARDGWAGLAWPARWGGRGAGFGERLVFAEEAARADAPDSLSRLGVDIIGPTIDVLGTDAQKAALIPPILDGGALWCQGFSEPGSGSDLASLRTRAVRVEDAWRIDGQKVWTSFGQYADMCLVLARTDPDAPAHKGISAFAVALAAPGVSVRPIDQITGGNDFCEVFFDGVEVGADALVGEPGQGWFFAMTALGFERSINFMTRQVRLSHQVDDLVRQVRRHADRVPSRLKDRLVDIHVRSAELRATIAVLMAALDRGERPGPDSSASKVLWSETFQHLADLGAELEQTVPGLRDLTVADWGQTYVLSRATTIYAGTSEIQRNILAERGLGLPR